MERYREYRELRQYVKSDVGFFLGCGPSIGRITSEQKTIIEGYDVWVSNFFIWSDIIPDFYYAEVGGKYMKLWKEKLKEKGNLYKNVKFILHKDDPHDPIIDETPNVFVYEKRKKSNGAEYILDGFVSPSRGASLILILEMMYNLGYKKIILFGVDLSTSTYFWTDKKEYGDVPLQTNKNMKPHLLHTTAEKVIPFVKEFNKDIMKGCLYVGHKDTLLYPDLKYYDIEKGETKNE